MERLGDIVARVLAGVRETMEERKAGDREGPRQAARAGGGDKAPALARGDAHGSHHKTAVNRAKMAALNAAARR